MIYKNSKQKGSALIIALLIMGILMTLALGLSDLILREMKITNAFVDNGKAFYAAESGIEEALLDLHQNLPGFEIKSGLDEEDLNYLYSIENKTQSIPYVDPDVIDIEIAKSNPKEYLYNVLNLNDTYSVPLFTIQDDGEVNNIQDFRIEYFTDAELDPLLVQRSSANFDNIDMFRWKMTGILDDGTLFTETIGDFIPMAVGSSENKPTCVGPAAMEHVDFIDENSGIAYNANCNKGIWKWAREAFQKIGNQTIKRSEEGDDPYLISQFLESHKFVYLTISNILNPNVLKGLSDFEKRNNAKIYWRILTPNDEVIREFAKINSTGTSGGSRKQIEAFVRPDSFLPVFNFSLYRTQVGGEGDKQTPGGYVQPTNQPTLETSGN